MGRTALGKNETEVTSPRRLPTTSGSIFLRVTLSAVAVLSVLWSLAALRLEAEGAPLRRIAQAILDGDNLEDDNLAATLAYLDGRGDLSCDSTILGDRATIRLYAAARSHTAAQPDARERLDKAAHAIRSVLTCSPHQSFFWYALFWVEKARGRPARDYLSYLELSYDLSPNEAWIAGYRSPEALAHYHEATPQLQNKMRAEFLNLVRDNPRVAAATVAEIDDQVRSTIVPFVTELSLNQRRAFAAQLDAADLLVDVPGVEYRAGRAVLRPNRP